MCYYKYILRSILRVVTLDSNQKRTGIIRYNKYKLQNSIYLPITPPPLSLSLSVSLSWYSSLSPLSLFFSLSHIKDISFYILYCYLSRSLSLTLSLSKGTLLSVSFIVAAATESLYVSLRTKSKCKMVKYDISWKIEETFNK